MNLAVGFCDMNMPVVSYVGFGLELDLHTKPEVLCKLHVVHKRTLKNLPNEGCRRRSEEL